MLDVTFHLHRPALTIDFLRTAANTGRGRTRDSCRDTLLFLGYPLPGFLCQTGRLRLSHRAHHRFTFPGRRAYFHLNPRRLATVEVLQNFLYTAQILFIHPVHHKTVRRKQHQLPLSEIRLKGS